MEKKIKSRDLRLYYFLESFADENGIILKKNLPTQSVLGKQMGFKCSKTYRSHLNNLIYHDMVCEKKDKYIF